jgi:phosphatidylglycerophosphatase C
MTQGPAADRRPVVLFDLDGVLAHKDTFSVFTARRLRRGPWRLVLALPALPVLALTGGRPVLRGAAARYLVRVALLGADLQQVSRELALLGGEFAATPEWLLADGIERARHHLACGDRVVVVTASEHGLARALLDAVGLAEVELVASRLAPKPLGPGLEPHNYGAAKVAALHAADVAQPWTVMYTDSLADLATLRETERQVLVNPGSRLRNRLARELPCLSTETWSPTNRSGAKSK